MMTGTVGGSGSATLTGAVVGGVTTIDQSTSQALHAYRSAYTRATGELSRLRQEVRRVQIARMLKARTELRSILGGNELDDDEGTARFRSQVETFVARHGEAGVRAISAVVFDRPNSELAWFLLERLARSDDLETREARRGVLAAALESREPSLRYAAATGLGEFSDGASLEPLRRRLARERNTSVRRVIEAELR
jgi:hypothetical protein